MGGTLEGIRVLDLTHILSGPYATMNLADLGADVIKIERPGMGDGARGTGPFLGAYYSSYFMSINRNKRSVTLDLAHPKGVKVFVELVKRSDVLVENLVPGSLARLGLGYDVLEKHNPRLIYAAISGFGQTGPYAQRPALDIIVQGMSGLMSITGAPGMGPVRVGTSVGDIVAGLYCVIGILAALQERQRSGKGQMLDISMLECQVAMQENAFCRYFATGEVPKPLGTRHPVSVPFQAFQTRDGWVVVAVVGEEAWPLFCSVIDRGDLIGDERFATNWDRCRHYDELAPVLDEIFLHRTTQEWVDAFTAVGVPCGPVNTIDQVVRDPQVLHRQAVVEIAHPTLGPVKAVNNPMRLSRTSPRVRLGAPDLGEHTGEVLREVLGYSNDLLEQLRRDKVIA
ncbi:MAG: CoA transferase [Chloroflexi bacterium]|nr:CoA transferase [Chloroflexota bacterium]